jgi:hypothetical protein
VDVLARCMGATWSGAVSRGPHAGLPLKLAHQNGSTSHLTVLAVQLNLPGQQAEQLEAHSIRAGGEHGYQILAVSLRNTGTQLLKPTGALQVQETGGRLLKTIPLQLDTLLPQTAIDYPAFVEGQALGPGHYQAALTLRYGAGGVLNFTTTFAITAQDLQQTFGNRPPNTLPSGAGGSGGPSPLVVAAAVVLGLAALGTGAIFFVPGLRARVRVFKRRSQRGVSSVP